MPETTILTEDEVAEIETAQVKRRESLAFHQSGYPGLPSPDYIEQIDALCQTVRALRAELAEAYGEDCEICEQVIISPNGDKVYTFIVCGRCWNTAQEKLAAVTQERDHWRDRCLRANADLNDSRATTNEVEEGS
jgi:hypothetical protein